MARWSIQKDFGSEHWVYAADSTGTGVREKRDWVRDTQCWCAQRSVSALSLHYISTVFKELNISSSNVHCLGCESADTHYHFVTRAVI
jgi:hypothetical protein